MRSLDRRGFIVGGVGLTGAGLLGAVWLDDSDQLPEETVKRGELDRTVQQEKTVRDEHVELLDDGRVEYPTTMSGGEPVETDTLPFDEWADLHCRSAGPNRIQHFTSERHDLAANEQTLSFTYGTPIDPGLEAGVLVEYIIRIDPSDGDTVVDRPTVSFEDIVASTPRTVATTIEFRDRTHTCTVPVWVQRVHRTPTVPL